MEEFLDDFKLYIIQNTDLITVKDLRATCTLSFAPSFAASNYHVMIQFRFESFYQGVPTSVAITICRANEAEICHKRVAFVDFDKLVRNNAIKDMIEEVISYEVKVQHAEIELTSCFEIFSL